MRLTLSIIKLVSLLYLLLNTALLPASSVYTTEPLVFIQNKQI